MRFRGMLLVGLIVLLAGCGQFNVTPVADITVGFEPTAFGFEVTPQGIEVAAHIARFSSKAGAVGAYIEGYRIEYKDPSGNAINSGDEILYSRGSLNIFVPPGILCDLPDPLVGCELHSPGARFAPGPVVFQSNFINLGARIVEILLENNPVGARADVFFNGTDALGREFMTGPFEVGLVFPVGAR